LILLGSSSLRLLLLPFQRFIDEMRGEGEGASVSKDGGAAMTVFRSGSIVEFPDGLDKKLSFVKVGEDGLACRCYTNCCKSQMTNYVAPKVVVFSSNFIRNGGDGSPYEPPGPVMNVNAKHAFDPSAVPDPRSDVAPLGLIAKFFRAKISPFGPNLAKTHPDLFSPDPSRVKTVPITW
jgi:hypothetical protein